MFRNDQDKLIYTGLFVEEYASPYNMYTLSDKDKTIRGGTYPSLYRLYIEEADVTEYNFASKYFESYQHWDTLTKMPFFVPFIERWRKELELKIKSQALADIMKQAKSEDFKKAFEASKFIYEKVYVGEKNTKGRPSKKQIKEEAEKQAKESKVVLNDFERLMIN